MESTGGNATTIEEEMFKDVCEDRELDTMIDSEYGNAIDLLSEGTELYSDIEEELLKEEQDDE